MSPHNFIPITDIVPVVRSLASEQAQALEVTKTLQKGLTISCQKGCGACCQRLMVPVSPPEAFALARMLKDLPQDHRERIEHRLRETRARLQTAGLLPLLQDLAESPRQKSDSDIDPINRAYYALRLPCIFLEDNSCSIYEHRPAACREYLVTSPVELCEDTEKNPVEELHNPLRASTVLSLLWADLTGGPVRLMPLPVAFEWAENHQDFSYSNLERIRVIQQNGGGIGEIFTTNIGHPVSKETNTITVHSEFQFTPTHNSSKSRKALMNFDPAIAAHQALQQAEQQGELGDLKSDILEAEEIFSTDQGQEAKQAYETLQQFGEQLPKGKMVSRIFNLYYVAASHGRPLGAIFPTWLTRVQPVSGTIWRGNRRHTILSTNCGYSRILSRRLRNRNKRCNS